VGPRNTLVSFANINGAEPPDIRVISGFLLGHAKLEHNTPAGLIIAAVSPPPRSIREIL